jgi:predicted Zn-dependent protease
MRRRFAWIAVGLLALASPLLWASYHHYAGLAAFQRYHSAEARTHLEACLRVWPWSHSVRLHLLAARAARREGDFEAAKQHLHECQDNLGDNSPQSGSVLEWAMLRAAEGDLDTVEEPLKEGLRNGPEQAPLILEALAEGYLRLSRVLDALRSVDAWLSLQPDNVQALYLRAKIHRQVGAAQKAAEDCRRVIELDPQRDRARWWLALALLEIGRYQEAVGHLEFLRKRSPEDADIRVRMAQGLSLLGQNVEARALLDGVLAEHPDHGMALFEHGQIAMRGGQLAEAETWLRRAALALPYDYKAQWALGDCLRRAGKTEEAEVQIAHANQLKDRRQRQGEIMTHLMSQRPNDPALQCELGTLLLQLGDPKQGESWLLHALYLDENYVPAYEALADYYQQRGDLDKADECRQRIGKIVPPKSPATHPK